MVNAILEFVFFGVQVSIVFYVYIDQLIKQIILLIIIILRNLLRKTQINNKLVFLKKYLECTSFNYIKIFILL